MVGSASSTGNASHVVVSALPACHMHVFRHLSKAAGTTMRFIFDKQAHSLILLKCAAITLG